jgi:hypothetical protein
VTRPAPRTSPASPVFFYQEVLMDIELLKPAALIASILYAIVGVLIF